MHVLTSRSQPQAGEGVLYVTVNRFGASLASWLLNTRSPRQETTGGQTVAHDQAMPTR